MIKKYFTTILSVLFVVGLVVGQNAMASLGASVSASPGTVIINQPTTLNVSISNSGSSALTLSQLNITAFYNGNSSSRVPAAFSVYQPSSVVLAANSTTSVPMTAIFFAPSTGITGSGSGKYLVGANFSTSDGSITSAANGASLTVNPVLLPAYERQ